MGIRSIFVPGTKRHMNDTQHNEPDNVSINQEKLFWIFTTLYWGFFWMINLAALPANSTSWTNFSYFSLHMFSAFLLSVVLYYALYRRFQCHRFPLRTLIPLVIVYSLFLGTLRDYCAVLLTYLYSGFFPRPIKAGLYLSTVVRFGINFVTWSALYFSLKMYEQLVREKREAQQARLMAQSAQLEVLRYQLNPHFLFNTLSSLRALTTRNPKKAKDVVTKISEFLRYSLSGATEDQVPLSKEIEIIRHYIDIERIQYGKKLLVEINIDPLTEDVPIPIFLIHPLVENAVKHGMRTSPVPLRITLTTAMTDDEFCIEIINSGHWNEHSQTPAAFGTGTGLANVRKRLEHFYPNNHRLDILKHEDAVVVTIHLKSSPGEHYAKKV